MIRSTAPAAANWWPMALLLLLPAIAVLIVGLFRLGDRALTLDETTSYFLTQIGWARFFEEVADSKANMSLYFSLLRLWPLTADEAGLRSLSVIFGVLTIPPFVAVARRFLPIALAGAAAIAVVVNPLFIAELRDARGYSLAVLLTVAGTWLLVRAREADRLWLWAAYGVTMGAALFAHFFTAPVLVAHAVGMLWTRTPVLRRGPLVAAALVGAALIPIVALVVTKGGPALVAVPPTTWEQALATLSALAGSGMLVGVYALGLILAAVVLVRDRGLGEMGVAAEPAFRIVYAGGVVTLGLILALSTVRPVLVDRYLLVALPFVVLATAGACRAISPRLAHGALALIIVISGMSAWAQLTGPMSRPPDWVARMVDSAEPGDGVVFDQPQYRKILAYYAARADGVTPLELVGSDAPITFNPYEETTAKGRPIDQMACDHPRVWVIGPRNLERGGTRLRQIVRELDRSYTEVDSLRFGRRELRLFERDESACT
jgi:4-amino-4-deoxy-L-arabinose transferase-like glycosyltransferase